MYHFGVYHWRRRLRRLASAAAALAGGALCLRSERGILARALGTAALLWGAGAGRSALAALADPPPWRVRRGKYEALAATLPLGSADVVADVGCGTGRSLVGLAPAVAEGTTVVAADVFDDRVILGNAPRLARENAAEAGLSVGPVRGDAASLPLATGSVDVLTACRLLHDLPRADAEAALREARRALAPGGTLGLLELPIPHEDGADPEEYWRGLLVDAGFAVVTGRTIGDEYVAFAARPRPTDRPADREPTLDTPPAPTWRR